MSKEVNKEKSSNQVDEPKEKKHKDVDEDEGFPVMGKDEYYPDNHVEKILVDSHISRRDFAFHGLMGFQSFKRYNLHFLTDNTIIYTVGNKYQIYNLETKESQTYHGHDNDGVGSIAVHPSKKWFAVAEKGAQPLIYIYAYPSLKLYRILKGGTEMMYVHCEFSNGGDKLVSLGGEPDFTITVWDWLAQRVILKSKAFGQEVFRASFSPYTEDIIFTSGSTHIKFWKMASTFTGLKLQGEIGKFGKLELSDVAAFYELPDGKVLSGTDQGTMILWDGVQVKAHLVLEFDGHNKKPLHNGAIEVILFENEEFITAGTDGYIKWWSLSRIDNAEADEVAEVVIEPLKEICIKTEDGVYAHIVNMKRGNNFWLVQDARGYLWHLGCNDFEAKIVMNFHCGKITDMAVSDSINMCLSVAEDGCIKLWDYVRLRPIYQVRYNGRAECVDLLRRSDVNKGRVAAVGYSSGIVRVVYFSETKIELGVVFKAADSAIVRIKYSPAQNMLVTASKTGEIFFFEVNGHADLSLYNALCMIQLPDKCSVTDLKWDSTSSKILISADNGKVYEIQKPVPSQINNRETYLVQKYPIREWRMKMMEFQMAKNQKKDEAEEALKKRMRLRGQLVETKEVEDEDWDPECITRVCYHNDNSGRFFVGTVGKYAGYYYLCDFNSERPLEAFPMPKETKISFISFSNFGDLFIIGFENGDIRISNVERPQNFLSVKQHDGNGGLITAAKLSFDERFLVSSGGDGLIFVHLLDKFMIQQESKFIPQDTIEGIEYLPEETAKQFTREAIQHFQEENPPNIPEVDQGIDGLDDSILAISLRMPADVPDILDESIYSIQQAKLRTEEDHRLKLAEEKKQNVRKKVYVLRQQFKSLQDKNNANLEVLRVGEDDFNIDPEYFEKLGERNEDKRTETRKEVQWNLSYHKLRVDKLRDKFQGILDFDKFTVKALSTQSYVTTFRIPKMSQYLQNNIKQFKDLLEKEIDINEQTKMNEDELLNSLDDRGMAGKSKEKAKTAYGAGQKKQEQVFKTEADRKRAERKVQREHRKAEIEQLKNKEHMNQGEDKEELAKIEQAKATFGEFDLKMSENYIVPEHQQVNHLKKKQQMILLEGSIHKLKMDFNDKVQHLKMRKVEIIEKVDNLYSRLSEINKELAMPDETVKYLIDDKVENPNHIYLLTDEDIEAYRLELIQRDIDEKAKHKTGGKGKGKKAAETEKERQEADKKLADDKKKADEAQAKKTGNAVNMADLPDHERKMVIRNDFKVQESELYNEIKMIRQIELQYEKERIKEEINKKITDFDEEICEMQKEKYRLESDLKNAEIKLILLFEELIMLKSLESTDQELSQKLSEFKQKKGTIIKQITSITKQLQEKREKIDEIQHREQDLKRRFHELCPEGSDQYAALSQFYEKLNIRRKKPEKKKEENVDEDEDEDVDAAEEAEEEEDDGDDEDQGIAGLNQEDYKIDDIENLRNERLDLFDEKSGIQATISDLQKEQKEMDRNEREINANLIETEDEIRDFQREKMQKLNQLEVAIVLKVKQIQNLKINPQKLSFWCNRKQQRLDELNAELQNGGLDEDQEAKLKMELDQMQANMASDWRGMFLPKTLGDSVLFTCTQLLQLLNRKEEIDNETKKLNDEQTTMAKQKNKKKKEKAEHKMELESSERDYDDKRMLRFGNLVDLDGLEVSGPSQIVIDLQNKFAKMDSRCYKLKEDAQSDLQSTQRDLTETISQNTAYLNYIRELGEKLQEQQKKLDGTNKAIFVDEDNEEKKKSLEQREMYKEKLAKQAEDINKIKNEINLYKRKGGHIYTKVTTNRKVAQLNDN